MARFINLAQKQDLLVILRPGPYICSEWDYGGFPFWIYEQCGDKIRTSDDKYIGLVDKWFGMLFSKLTPLLYAEGGPIIALQVSKIHYVIMKKNIVIMHLVSTNHNEKSRIF